MTAQNLKNEVQSKYNVGQEIILKKRDRFGKVYEKLKVKIKGFYPRLILTEHHGYNECFTYWDFLKMTTDPDKQDSK